MECASSKCPPSLFLVCEVYSAQWGRWKKKEKNIWMVRSKPEGSVGGNTNTLLCVCVLQSRLVTVEERRQELGDLQGEKGKFERGRGEEYDERLMGDKGEGHRDTFAFLKFTFFSPHCKIFLLPYAAAAAAMEVEKL